jgi:hopanoid biosynthesis associated protein HpnK
VERGHREGILTSASLMVAEPAAEQAVEIARRLPSLRIGLHLTLVDGTPASPARDIPDLVGADGRFRPDLARMGAAIFFLPAVRRQMEHEILAQFDRFTATGLPLDHVNAHRHYHLHPSIASIAARLAAKFGARWLRVPDEPFGLIDGIELGAERIAHLAMAPFVANLRGQARRRGLRGPDRVVGFRWSGAMTGERLRGVLARLPEGNTEIYLHPATAAGFPGAAVGYRYAEEFQALIDAATLSEARRLRDQGVRICGLSDID